MKPYSRVLLINGDTPGIPRQLLGHKAVRGLRQRLEGNVHSRADSEATN